jgi:hypothetical protein
MRDGAFWELMTQVRHIEGKESGSWRIPTPICSDAYTSNLKSTQQKPDTMHSVSLAQLCEKMPEKMWPTPTSCMSKGTSENALTRKDGKSRENDRLDHKVLATGGQSIRQTYPTPCTQDYKRRGPNSKQQGLPEQIKKMTYPTPTVNGNHNRKGLSKTSGDGLATTITRSVVSIKGDQAGQTAKLNPDWVEWLMGWPIAWTDLKPLEMDRFHSWLQLHGLYCRRV